MHPIKPFAKVVAEATTLRLSYKNVLKIDNLQGFSRLTKLCLDNNIIQSIRFDLIWYSACVRMCALSPIFSRRQSTEFSE